MEYLNYEGLKHYHSKVRELIDYEVSQDKYTPGNNIIIEGNVISAVVPEFDPEVITNPEIDLLFK